MEIVAEMPESRIEGFLAAGHAATITGWGVFEAFVERHRVPVVVAGSSRSTSSPALVRLIELIRDGRAAGRERVSALRDARGKSRGAAAALGGLHAGRRAVARDRTRPDGNLRLRDRWSHLDARRRFAIDLARALGRGAVALAQQCVCGDIMSGLETPADCALFGDRVRARTRPSAPAWSAARAPAASGTSTGAPSRAVEARMMHAWPTSERIAMKHGAGGRAMRAARSSSVLGHARAPGGVGLGDGRRRGDSRRRRLARHDDRLARHPADRSSRAATSAGSRCAAP